MELAVAVQQVLVVEVPAERREELLGIVFGDVVVERDNLLFEQVPVDDVLGTAVVGVVEDVRSVTPVLAVGFPADGVEPREERAFDPALGGCRNVSHLDPIAASYFSVQMLKPTTT